MVDKNRICTIGVCPLKRTSPTILIVAAAVLLWHSSLQAGQWYITPALSFIETFSDNINLAPSGSERSAFVTQVNPGVSIQRIGGRLNLNLNYQMQNVINRGGGGGVDVNNQLIATANSELVRNRLYLNAASSIGQQNIVNTGLITTSNINTNANRTDVYTFSVNPVWTPRIGGYANGIVNMGYNLVNTSNSATGTANTYFVNAQLLSGYKFSNIGWRLGYNDSYSDRSLGGNVRFTSYNGEVRYFFTRKYAAFISFGNSSNTFQSNTNTNQNGSFYLAGLAWIPTQKLALEGGYGKNLQYVQVQVRPTFRTNLAVRFQHSGVGTNTGDVWNATLNHTMGRSNWQARYFEDTTTTQQILLGQNPFNQTLSLNAAGVASNIALPTLTNQVIVRKQGQVSVSGVTGRSTLGLVLFHSRREFQVSLTRDTSIGAIASWGWRFTPRTNALLRLSWNRNTTENPLGLALNRRNNIYDVSIRLTRNIGDYFNISKNMNGSLEYRHIRQDSSDPTVSYDENRIIALFNILF